MNLSKDDIDILIPLYFDHPDRVVNAHRVIDYLQGCGLKNIFVREHYTARSPEYSLAAKIGKNFTSHFIEEGDNFNKMQCVNDMVAATSSKCLAIWDVDVIFPKSSIDKTLDLFNSGSDVVFPYNGNFYNIPKKHFDMLTSGKIDLGQCELWNENSYGGCVMFKREVFEAGGGGNENFVGWGFEDDEIFVRYSKLGYKINRVDAPLFHMEHERTQNADGRSPHYLNNNRLYNKICAMSKEELLKEIDTWK